MSTGPYYSARKRKRFCVPEHAQAHNSDHRARTESAAKRLDLPAHVVADMQLQSTVHALMGESSCVVCGGLIRVGTGAKLRIRPTVIDGEYLLTSFCGRCYRAAN